MRKYRAAILLPAALASTLTLGACARQISPNSVAGTAVGETMQTYAGTIRSARYVQVQEHETLEGNTTGQIIGGLAGGVAGSRFGGGLGKAIAIGAGALLGAAAGALAEQEVKKQVAIEYVVQLDSGRLLTVVQGSDVEIRPGERVFVQQSNRGRSRVIRA